MQYHQGTINRDEFNAKCAALTNQVKARQKELTDINATTSSVQPEMSSRLQEQVHDLETLEQLQTLDRDIVDKLIQNITVYPDNRIEISWNFDEGIMKLLTDDEC